MKMRLVYICSPYRGNIKDNIRKAREYCDHVMRTYPDVIPIAPHLYFPQFLDDTNPRERRQGMDAALELLDMCSEIWVYGEPTQGMQAEICRAVLNGIPVKRYHEYEREGEDI